MRRIRGSGSTTRTAVSNTLAQSWTREGKKPECPRLENSVRDFSGGTDAFVKLSKQRGG